MEEAETPSHHKPYSWCGSLQLGWTHNPYLLPKEQRIWTPYLTPWLLRHASERWASKTFNFESQSCYSVHVCSVVSDSCWPHGLWPTRLLVHGIFQARTLEWVAISSSRGSSWPRNQTQVSCIPCTGRQILYHSATWEAPAGVCCSLNHEVPCRWWCFHIGSFAVDINKP